MTIPGLRIDRRTKSAYDGIKFFRYSLEDDFKRIRLDTSSAQSVTHRRSKRRNDFIKRLNGTDLSAIYWKAMLQHEKDLYPQPQYPQQAYPPAPTQQAPTPTAEQFQALMAEVNRLRQEAQQNSQAVQDYQKKERMATYRIRRAKQSGNVSLNWGPENIQGAYLIPIKYADGRQFASASGAPATFQLAQTPQGPVIVCTIQNGPLNPEEVQLWNEMFVQPQSVIPARRGPASKNSPPQGAPVPQASPQYPPAPQQTQFPAQPQYPPQQFPPQAPAPQYQGVPGGSGASIAHLPKEVQDQLMNTATQLMQKAPQVYTSLDSALLAAKKAANIP